MEWALLVLKIMELVCDKTATATDEELKAELRHPKGLGLRIAAAEKAKQDGKSPLLWRRYKEMVLLEAERATEEEIDDLIATYRRGRT